MNAINSSVRHLSLDRSFELTASSGALERFRGLLPLEFGAAWRNDDGHAQLLHVAPHRWFIPAPGEALLQSLTERAVGGNAALVDVEGKWQWFQLDGSEAVRILESSVNVATLMARRDCAPVSLFDCPAILLHRRGRFDCWVTSSYAATFLEAIASLPKPRAH